MKTITASRASLIIYNFIESNKHLFQNKIVLLPGNVCPVLPATLLKSGVAFDFIDINLDTLCHDHQPLLNYIRKVPVSCIFYIRSFGYIENTLELFREIRKIDKNLIIVDDRCACIPETKVPDEMADMYLYSTGYAKFVEFGKGGFAFLRESFNYQSPELPFSDEAHQKLVEQMNESIKNNNLFVYKDTNWLGHTDEIDTKEVYLQKIEEQKFKVMRHKNSLNKIYASMLPRHIQLPAHFQQWRFSLLVNNKQEILTDIFKHGLFASSHYSAVSHLFSAKHSFKAENIHARIINLFNDFRYTPEMAKQCAQIITSKTTR